MSFCFNWSRLDDTAAEALRLLINGKLSEVLQGYGASSVHDDAAGETSVTTSTTGTAGSFLRPVHPVTGVSSSLMSSVEGMPLAETRVGGQNNVGRSHTSGSHHSGLPATNIGGASGTLVGRGTQMSEASNGATASVGVSDAQSLPQHPPGSSLPSVVHASPSATAAVSQNPAASQSCKQKPLPIESIEVSDIEWGTASPFIEIVSMENAIPFSAQGSLSNVRDMSTFGNHDRQSFSVRQGSLQSRSACDPVGRHLRHGSPVLFSCTASGDALNDPLCPAVDGRNPSCAANGVYGGASSLGHTSQPMEPVPSIGGQSASPSLPQLADSLAPFVGPDGLYLRLHVTYGGSMRVVVKIVIRHNITFGPLSLPVRMPLSLTFTDIDLDCFVCLNLHHNACRLWLEPGKLSDSPVNRLSTVAVFGERPGERGSTMEAELTSNGGLYSKYESSFTEDDNGSVFIEEVEIAQFVLRELRSVLEEKVVAPHFMCFPLQA